MPSNVLMKSKLTLSREELAEVLESLAAKIRDGRMTLSGGGNTVTLDLPAAMRVDTEVKDSVKPNRITRELEIEIEWRVDETGQPVGDAGTAPGLTIS